MATSEARRLANIENARRSNSFKHGMTGAGVVLAEIQRAEVDDLAATFRAEMKPVTEIGGVLVDQMALLMVRMERCEAQDMAAVASRVRNAPHAFDEQRHDRAEALLEDLAEMPRTPLRRLRAMPEGVDLLIDGWKGLRGRLSRFQNPGWIASDLVEAAGLLGNEQRDARDSDLGLLAQVSWGELDRLPPGFSPPPREADARRSWALGRMIERVDATIAELEAHRLTLDLQTIALDRAEAGERAVFDPSKEAALARRYEAEARRGFFRAFQELKKVEAGAAAPDAVPRSSASSEMASIQSDLESLGSFREILKALGDDPQEKPLRPEPEPATPVNRPSFRDELAHPTEERLMERASRPKLPRR